MVDKQFLRLSDRWALAHNKNQWIVQRLDGGKWCSVSFVASEKRVLMRVLREKGAEISPDARVALDALPETFRAWRAEQEARQPREEAAE